ncbi:uncharacterized protein LOC135436223 [Drosophila montana]|uniref:uncharacterized protein LOC135436223 n=1 Tax=Drosophila montana TaxID=40370 RepID=UPI00313DF7AD
MLTAMAQVKFLFDIIVTRLQLNKYEFDKPQDLVVRAKFNKIGLAITSSRINVTDFRAGRYIEFKAEPQMLRDNLKNIGMLVTVEDGGISLGTGTLMFPPSFIDKIAIGMSDLVYADTCGIQSRDKEVGCMELLCSLIIKCDDPELDSEACQKRCEHLCKEINQADIMFVVDKPELYAIPCKPCSDELKEDEEGDEQLRRDLNRYRSFNQRVTQPPEDTSGMQACCQLKNLMAKCGEVIDSVIKRIAQLSSPLPAEHSHNTSWHGTPVIYNSTRMPRTIPVGDMEEMDIKPIRFCPVCLCSMSWLPKYACCPRCWAKPMVEPKNESKDVLTADIIIKRYADEPHQAANGLSDKENIENTKRTNRCTCKLGKMCAHCRVRNLCSDIFISSSTHIPNIKPKANEDFCVQVKCNGSPATCRTHLQIVLSELKLLYQSQLSCELDAKSS